MKMLPTYVSPNGVRIEFHSISDVPGFSHRVFVNGIGRDWLGDEFKPSAKVAQYFLEKHVKA
jgi:hypothetical protein